ncbi:MAG: helix-turn-helix domain-containing protein [Clostridiales bacterium]|nr:helix-turn-helix domain-containing protein [Clostridiales bacterium]
MDTKEFGAFIAQERKARGMTQKELADKINVTDKAVSRWENGHGYPDIETLEDLSGALGISLLELMHSRRQEDITVSVEEASRTISETIKINIDDRKKERKITALIFASSMAILLLISVFKNLAPVVWIAEAVGIIYLIASVLMFVDSKRNRSTKKMLIGILLAMIPLFILLLLLTTSVNVTYN